MPRPPVKKTRKLAEAQAFGAERGRLKAQKKLSIEERVLDYVNKVVENTTADDAINTAIYAGLAYAGYQLFGDWKGALWGPIGLKLATANSEVAAVAGITMLASLGVGFAVTSGFLNEITKGLPGWGNYKKSDATSECAEGYAKWVNEKTGEYICATGNTNLARAYGFVPYVPPAPPGEKAWAPGPGREK